MPHVMYVLLFKVFLRNIHCLCIFAVLVIKTLGNLLPKILTHAQFCLFFPTSLAEMFPLVNTGVAGMTYLSSKRLMVGVPGRHHSCSSGSGALLGGWVLDLS